jgi:protein-disulfide isomerase
MGALAGSILINLNMTTCRSPGESEKGHTPEAGATNVDLPGVDTSQLTAREKREWSSHVSEQLAPCADQPVSIAQCVQEKRPCAGCLPAAKYLLDQVQKGRTRTQAEAAYRARFGADQVKQIELMGSPSKGPTDAPVVIVEFADFECPACRAASPVVDSVLEKHPNDVRLVFKNFPLEIHQNAETAARAAMAADRQGKFWDMHHALFTSEAPLTRSTLDSLAKKLGLDMTQFGKDLESEATADLVARDRKQGEAAKLHATPTIFINGREFNYADDLGAELDAWINLELELLGKPPSAPAPAPSAAPSAVPSAPAAGSAAPAPSAAPVQSAPAPSAAPKQAPAPSPAAPKKPEESAKGAP